MSRRLEILSARRTIAFALGLLVLVVLVEPASAQRGRGFRRLFGVSRAQLASHPDIQQELHLNDEQKTRVAEINDHLRDQRRELLGTAFDGWSKVQPQMEVLNNEASQKVNELLDPAQRQRLQQIAIQQNGPRALQDPEVVAELGLSDEQQTKLSAAVAENTKAFETGFGQASRDSWRDQANVLADQSDARLLGVLTDEQKTKLDELKGKSFDVDLSQFFRRGRADR